MHWARIVRIDSEHLPLEIRSLAGDSIGWWEDDTLVVETTNFLASPGVAREGLRIVERFSPIDEKGLLYQFEVEDPDYEASYSGELLWPKTDQRSYEYACHEGNYAMGNTLRGARLLEQNVRVFLQARSNVNRGIRNTIENESEMFFAYNNGITATAEHVTVRRSDDGLEITEIKNFQIVNGGQTTASIHTAGKKKENDISSVFVQMKLSIVNPDRTLEIVPKISEYANSQNRVSSADFFSNHPFHVRSHPPGLFSGVLWNQRGVLR